MKNLEIKAPAPDLAVLRHRALAGGARPAGVLEQVDTYYRGARGLLKLRVIAGVGAELIAYSRPVVAGSRISDYMVYPTADPDRLADVLGRSLERQSEVRKVRELLMYGGTRIHFDTVEGLGMFVELETEGNTRPAAETQAEHDRVIEMLGLDRAIFLAGSYVEMLTP